MQLITNMINRLRGKLLNTRDAFFGRMMAKAKLSAVVTRADGSQKNLGVISERVVTDAFVAYLVDAMQDSSAYPMDAFQHHASGTGTAAEAASDTALVNEVESRVSGTLTEGSGNNVFKTVATITYTATRSITEHGVFSASTGGTLIDRSVFSAINVNSGDSIQFSYELTFPSGG